VRTNSIRIMKSPISNRHNLYRLLRFVPFLMAALILAYAILVYFGVHPRLLESIADGGVVASFLLFVESKALGFCRLHRALIVYTVIVGLCVDFHRLFGFGVLLYPMLTLTIIVGSLLVLLSLAKRYCV
jgi:hypothetical protein